MIIKSSIKTTYHGNLIMNKNFCTIFKHAWCNYNYLLYECSILNVIISLIIDKCKRINISFKSIYA